MSAVPLTIGATSLGMSWPEYWLSASVLTMTSAPSLSAASRPAWKPAARPLLLVRRTMWSTPCSRATSTVRSVEPSSMTSHSTVSKPGTVRGRSASVAGSVASSLRQGIWMMSFMRGAGRGDGACGEVDAVHSLPASIPHGERDDHPAGPGSGPCDRPAKPVGLMARAPARGADPRDADRVRRLPDLSELRQLLLAAVGPRAAARRQAVLRRLPHADRAPAGGGVRRAAVDRRRSRRPDHGRRDARLVRRAGGRALPPGARVVRHARRPGRRG